MISEIKKLKMFIFSPKMFARVGYQNKTMIHRSCVKSNRMIYYVTQKTTCQITFSRISNH